jgi:hypothetical protein
MKLTTLGLVTSAAFMVTGAQALAATVIFDDFSIDSLAVDAPFPGTSNTDSVAFGAGTRTLTALNTQAGPAPDSSKLGDTQLEADSGVLSFSNNDGAQGRGTVTYTNVGDISSVANPYFLFAIGAFDNFANFFASATDTDGNTSTYFEALDLDFSPVLFFSQFTGSADFNTLASLSFSIDSTGVANSVDGSLDSISISAVPLPAGGLLLLGALGGLSALRRKKSA